MDARGTVFAQGASSPFFELVAPHRRIVVPSAVSVTVATRPLYPSVGTYGGACDFGPALPHSKAYELYSPPVLRTSHSIGLVRKFTRRLHSSCPLGGRSGSLKLASLIHVVLGLIMLTCN